MDIYLARQPIFSRKKEIFAYELLFRGGMENSFPGIDGNSATSRLLSNTFFNTGVEQITSGKKAFTPPGEGDWVLVLDDASKKFPKPGERP